MTEPTSPTHSPLRPAGAYRRYHIDTAEARDIAPWPTRFQVRVSRVGLARWLVKEMREQRGNLDVVLSRPCMYGVFSGPVGGFAPRPELCVGCLRCTTQHPDFVEIRHNPARQALGDSYFTFQAVDAISYEARLGSIPVKGAGYRGRFGGAGWDGMWTDMSEIVRPTRDGIHGREFISTVVDIGTKPGYLRFGSDGLVETAVPHTFSLPLPLLFDAPPAALLRGPASGVLPRVLADAAAAVQTLALLPLDVMRARGLSGAHLAPLLTAADVPHVASLSFEPRLVVLEAWQPALVDEVRFCFPEAVLALRRPFGDAAGLLADYERGARVFWLTADYHGRGGDGRFVIDLIRAAHGAFVRAGVREEVTLLGGGGIIAAEHVPKAIILGLDAVVLDTPLLVALQATFDGEFAHRQQVNITLPPNLPADWGVQRLKNLTAAWRDQLLEILGAMGLREVRRLRGEIGRAMFAQDLEREAFAGIDGY